MMLDQALKLSSSQDGAGKPPLVKQKQLGKLKKSIWRQIAEFGLSIALDVRQTQT